jgi:hypothetical protein
MGVENFVPEMWSASLFVKLRKSLIFGALCQRTYEGEIARFGDTVKINEIGPVTVTAYTKGATLSYESLSSAQKELKIDQASSFAFKIDDIDIAQAQSTPSLMDGAMSDAAYRIADTIDAYIAGLYAQAGATPSATTYIGASGGSLSVSSGNVIETFTYAQRYLSEKNVPTGGRWITVPSWLVQKLTIAATGAVSAIGVPKLQSDGALVNGYIGHLLGFDIYESQNISNNGTQYRIMCGTRNAIGYAGQVTEVERLRIQTTFATAARGLYVYGAKVTAPEELLTLYLAEAAG